ncbi:putative acetyltransferase [Hartmannibacter diazotrophicus]|uniref:Putative acetyltransferase n=1 Tax=Hartmannibacter diazotrophicus TaxID=1482074 RepID=A0A2C9D542_9HYPH|nr:GNAT family N-acetyltransferase [Hartmannibacter diazotrophicus]SON55343.1 putative acetyltransferase [Hartmannibacter diazotrophicus]
MLVSGFRTVRLEAYPLARPDCEPLRHLTDDPSITGAMDDLPSPFTSDDAMALIAANGAPWTFFGLHNGFALVGVVCAREEGTDIEVGYWIGHDYRGKGYATEALRGLLHWLKADAPRAPIHAECSPDNLASSHVLEKCGFARTDEQGKRNGRMIYRLAG